MALKLSGRYELPAPRQIVWDTILRPEVLREAIPGCSALEAESEDVFAATVTTKIGPIKATFRGKVELRDKNPPDSLLITGAGEGGIAGFAKGNARIALSDGPTPGTTVLEYEGDVAIGGKLAQLGARLINGVAQKMADQFFANLVAVFDEKSMDTEGMSP